MEGGDHDLYYFAVFTNTVLSSTDATVQTINKHWCCSAGQDQFVSHKERSSSQSSPRRQPIDRAGVGIVFGVIEVAFLSRLFVFEDRPKSTSMEDIGPHVRGDNRYETTLCHDATANVILKQDSGELEVVELVAGGPSQEFAHKILRGDVLVEVKKDVVRKVAMLNHNVAHEAGDVSLHL